MSKLTLHCGKLPGWLDMGEVVLGQYIGQLTEQSGQIGQQALQFMAQAALWRLLANWVV